MDNENVEIIGTDLYVDGEFIGDLYATNNEEREILIESHGLARYATEILEA